MAFANIIDAHDIETLNRVCYKNALIEFNKFLEHLGKDKNYKPSIQEYSDYTGWSVACIMYHLYPEVEFTAAIYSEELRENARIAALARLANIVLSPVLLPPIALITELDITNVPLLKKIKPVKKLIKSK